MSCCSAVEFVACTSIKLHDSSPAASLHVYHSAPALCKTWSSWQQPVNATRGQQCCIALQDPRMESRALHIDAILKRTLGRFKIVEAPIEWLLGNIAKVLWPVKNMEVSMAHGLGRTGALFWMDSKHRFHAIDGLCTSLKPPGTFGAVWQAPEEVSCGALLRQPIEIFR